MIRKPKVWFVDDLPSNLETFKRNHGAHFDVEVFDKPSAVLDRIHSKRYPDALLCDIFFYDSVEEATRVEQKIAELALDLKKMAVKIGVHDHRHAAGITLMRNIYEHFNRQPPPFPMYAYTSKGPFLLEQSEWNNISEYGAEVLLKGRVTPESERTEIVGDIAIHRAKNSLLTWLKKILLALLWALVPGLIYLLVGRWLRGSW